MSTSTNDPDITDQPFSLTLGNGGVRFIEKILDVTVEDGNVEYLIKWGGIREDDCSWEYEETLKDIPGFSHLAREFNQKRAEARAKVNFQKQLPVCAQGVGFGRGAPPQRIRTCEEAGEVCFLLKRKHEGEDLADVAAAKEACKRRPELVLEYST